MPLRQSIHHRPLTSAPCASNLAWTGEGFAARYVLEVETVRNWEAGRRDPNTTARSYLRAISNAPEHVEQAYAPTLNL